jgi:hypothetical protein
MVVPGQVEAPRAERPERAAARQVEPEAAPVAARADARRAALVVGATAAAPLGPHASDLRIAVTPYRLRCALSATRT